MTTELDYLKKELEENENIVSFALLYDRANKKFLAIHKGDDAIIEKMITRAVTTNGYFATMIRKVSGLFSTTIPKPPFGRSSISDLFDKFQK